jgi:hypothetical protein
MPNETIQQPVFMTPDYQQTYRYLNLIQYIRKMPSFPSKTTTYHSKWIPAYAGMTDFTFLLCIGLNQ